jgi:hypothetical protein
MIAIKLNGPGPPDDFGNLSLDADSPRDPDRAIL